MRSCSDCIHCKINIYRKTLRCNKGNWTNNWGMDKVLTVNKGEVGRSDTNIRHRAEFERARKCADYEEA